MTGVTLHGHVDISPHVQWTPVLLCEALLLLPEGGDLAMEVEGKHVAALRRELGGDLGEESGLRVEGWGLRVEG